MTTIKEWCNQPHPYCPITCPVCQGAGLVLNGPIWANCPNSQPVKLDPLAGGRPLMVSVKVLEMDGLMVRERHRTAVVVEWKGPQEPLVRMPTGELVTLCADQWS
jgi:hypothetical protein